MKTRKLGIALLVMLAIVTTTGTFAYWAGAVLAPTGTNTTTGTVTVGSGNDVSTSFTLTANNASGGNLVPATQLANSPAGSVDSVTLSYDVEWTEGGAPSRLGGTTSTAPITATPVVTMEDSGSSPITDGTILALVNVTPGSNPTTITLDDATASTFTWDITLTEPANSTDYAVLTGATITVTITYSLGAVSTTDN